MIAAFLNVIWVCVVLIPFAGSKGKGIIAVIAVSILAAISSVPALAALGGHDFSFSFSGSMVTGNIPVHIDALSAWFMLIISFGFVTGVFYGFHYMKPYQSQRANLSIHWVAYILLYASLLSICALQNSIAFLVAWEIMAITCFLLIIFEYKKKDTLAAGINFLIQAHIGMLLLTLGFIWVALKTNSYEFSAIHNFSLSNSMLSGIALFIIFFAGFAIKAGFVPFHTWLPYAHPAAPSHISGVLSGVIIKIGIYGIFRMLLLIKTDFTILGYIILFFSVLSGVYGVMLAILQHNLKKLLAYHSIENIGIIGIGIAIGCLGLGKGSDVLVLLGFGGALLHCVNHSLFKSILFYGAGNVYQATHTMNLDRLGGIGKKMPQTSFLFLIAALSICGLPPFNGFVSEFMLYSGMLSGLKEPGFGFLLSIITTLFSLALIGGLALLCFTKAYGSVFLGVQRTPFNIEAKGEHPGNLIPLYAGTILIILIGIFPSFFIHAALMPVHLFMQPNLDSLVGFPITSTVTHIGNAAFLFLVVTGLVYLLRKRLSARNSSQWENTWGCGYVAPSAKMQYTPSSFTRAYRKLVEPVISIQRKKIPITGIFPKTGKQEVNTYDKLEAWLIDQPVRQMKHFFNRFTFLQNGNTQSYILYGLIFISLVLVIPFLFNYVHSLLQFLNQI